MPDETRQPDPLEARARELADRLPLTCDYCVSDECEHVEEDRQRILATLRTVQQETARATWERAAQIAEQFAGRWPRRSRVTPEIDSARREAEAIAGTLRRQAATPLEDQQ